jgi:hypothetical protein
MLSEIVHVDVSVGLHPVFVRFDGTRPDQAQAAFGVWKDTHDIGPASVLLVEAFEHVRALEMLVVGARQAEEGQCLLDGLLDPAGEAGIFA